MAHTSQLNKLASEYAVLNILIALLNMSVQEKIKVSSPKMKCFDVNILFFLVYI